jgi:hypothetical protein
MPRKIGLCCAIFTVVLLVNSTMLLAKLVSIRLEKLVNDSDVIVYGRTMREGEATARVPGGLRMVSFEVTLVLKGESLKGKKRVQICNDPGDIESYDLGKVVGSYVVFTKSSGGCFRPVLGLRSVVQTEGHFALTGNIADEPQQQDINSFLTKVKALASLGSRGSS